MHHQDQDTTERQSQKKNPPITHPGPQRATSFLPSSEKNKTRGKEKKGRNTYSSLELTGNKSSTSCSPTTGMNSCFRAMEKHKGRSSEGRRKSCKELQAKAGAGGGLRCHSNEGNGRHSGNVARAGKSDQGDDDGVKAQKQPKKNKSAVFFFLILRVSCTWTLASTYSRPLSLFSYWFINLKCTIFFFLFWL